MFKNYIDRFTAARGFKLIALIALAAGLVLLSGCVHVQTNISLYGEEQWSGLQAVTVTSELAGLVQENEGLLAYGGPLIVWEERAKNAADADKRNRSYRKDIRVDGSETYLFIANGERYDTLNQLFFDGQAEILLADVDGDIHITIRHDFTPAVANALQPVQNGLAATGQPTSIASLDSVLRITGGQVISSNATRVDGNTAIWENPTQIEIKLIAGPQASADAVAYVSPGNTGAVSMSAMDALLGRSPASVTEGEPEAAPAAEEEALPASGGVRPAETPAGLLIMAGLGTLVALFGAGWLKINASH